MPQLRRAAHRLLASAGLWIGLAACLVPAEGSRAVELFAGNYSFSDELGGFRLVSAGGGGSSMDPVTIVEQIGAAGPVTLVVRRHSIARIPRGDRSAALTMELILANRSDQIWAGFEIELQEHLGQPSVYTDGLSFNQLGPQELDVSSDSFTDSSRMFEPHDRIRFECGSVDPGATARFRVTITDPTPDLEFYVVQEPKLAILDGPTSPDGHDGQQAHCIQTALRGS